MKRHGSLWPQVTSFHALVRAAEKAQRGKRFRPSVAGLVFNLESKLLQLQRELLDKTYQPAGPILVALGKCCEHYARVGRSTVCGHGCDAQHGIVSPAASGGHKRRLASPVDGIHHFLAGRHERATERFLAATKELATLRGLIGQNSAAAEPVVASVPDQHGSSVLKASVR